MRWPIYLALKQLFPSGRRWPSFFFVMAVLGVALGVMILVIVQSVMGGFGQTYREKIVETSGHIRIETGSIYYEYEELLDQLDAVSEIKGAAPYAQGVVMLTHYNRPAFPFIKGIDIEREREVVALEKFITQGSLDDFDDESVLLSQELAYKVGAFVGDTVEVYTPLMLEKLKEDEVLLPRELKVAAIYQTGWNQFDTSTMVGSLFLVQELYGMEGGVHGIAVTVKNGVDEIAAAAALNKWLPKPNYAFTWLDLYDDFLWVLKLEKTMMLYLLLFIVLVAAFAIAIAQLLTVIRKTREIGLLGAIGASRAGLGLCYCFQGFFIGTLGTTLGIVLALTALYFRNPIIHTLSSLTGTRETLVKFYQFSNLPVHYTMADFVIISVSAIILATAAGAIPAYRAAKLLPADALRSE